MSQVTDKIEKKRLVLAPSRLFDGAIKDVVRRVKTETFAERESVASTSDRKKDAFQISSSGISPKFGSEERKESTDENTANVYNWPYCMFSPNFNGNLKKQYHEIAKDHSIGEVCCSLSPENSLVDFTHHDILLVTERNVSNVSKKTDENNERPEINKIKKLKKLFYADFCQHDAFSNAERNISVASEKARKKSELYEKRKEKSQRKSLPADFSDSDISSDNEHGSKASKEVIRNSKKPEKRKSKKKQRHSCPADVTKYDDFSDSEHDISTSKKLKEKKSGHKKKKEKKLQRRSLFSVDSDQYDNLSDNEHNVDASKEIQNRKQHKKTKEKKLQRSSSFSVDSDQYDNLSDNEHNVDASKERKNRKQHKKKKEEKLPRRSSFSVDSDQYDNLSDNEHNVDASKKIKNRKQNKKKKEKLQRGSSFSVDSDQYDNLSDNEHNVDASKEIKNRKQHKKKKEEKLQRRSLFSVDSDQHDSLSDNEHNVDALKERRNRKQHKKKKSQRRISLSPGSIQYDSLSDSEHDSNNMSMEVNENIEKHNKKEEEDELQKNINSSIKLYSPFTDSCLKFTKLGIVSPAFKTPVSASNKDASNIKSNSNRHSLDHKKSASLETSEEKNIPVLTSSVRPLRSIFRATIKELHQTKYNNSFLDNAYDSPRSSKRRFSDTIDEKDLTSSTESKVDKSYYDNKKKWHSEPSCISQQRHERHYSNNHSTPKNWYSDKFNRLHSKSADQSPYSPLSSASKRRKTSNLPPYDAGSLQALDLDIGFIDAHCHLDFLFNRNGHQGSYSCYKDQKDFPVMYEGCVAVFCDPHTFARKSLWGPLLEEKNVWAAFGCHPHNSKDYDEQIDEDLLTVLKHHRVVALGEIGLDYSNRNNCTRSVQHKVFRRQIEIGLRKKLPLVIHCRDAQDDCLEIMKELVPTDHKIHLHCFMNTWEMAEEWLNTFPNLCIGITNVVTFPSAESVHEVACKIPLDRLLLETDTPYFIPRTVSREERWSHPGMAIHVAAQIAALKKATLEEVLRAVRKNTKRIYNI